MSKIPQIGFHNVLESATAITGSKSTTPAYSELAANSPSNLIDGRTDTYWTPSNTDRDTYYLTATFSSPTAADYVALQGHNLGTVGYDARLQSNDGTNWVDAYTSSSKNLLSDPEDFTTASWSTSFASITSSAQVFSSRGVIASKLVEDTNNNNHEVTQTISVTAGSALDSSIFLKAGERSWARLLIQDTVNTSSFADVYVDLSTGQLGTVTTSGTWSGTSAAISDEGDGSFRLSINTTVTGTTSLKFRMLLAQSDGVTGYTGDGTSGIYIWGAQVTNSSAVVPYKASDDDTIIFKRFTQTISSLNASNESWRLVLTPKAGGTGIPRISNLFIGVGWDMATGFKGGHAPVVNLTDKVNSASEGRQGAFLGRSTRTEGVSTSLRFEKLTEVHRTRWNNFRDHAESKPFFVSFDSSDVNDALYCWTTNKPMLVHKNPVMFDATLPIKGLKE